MDIPGFVDLQVNGYRGVDFSSHDLTREGFVFACKELIKQGTVAFLPTIITSSPETFERNLKLMAGAIDHADIKGHVLGIHVEGPFISAEDGARGAHNMDWVQKPDIKFLDELYKWSEGNLKLITIAAEVEGSGALCNHAVKLGITVSLGHQMATETDLEKLAASGATSLTHLGNGLPGLLPRHKNPLWAGIANDDLKAMVIADGHHLPPSVLKTIIRTKGVSNTIVVSDASPIAGLAPGKYNTLGNDVVLEASGYLYNPQTGYLVGSSSTMIDCMNYLSGLQILKTEELFDLGFYNPLRLIHVDPAMIIERCASYVEKEDEFILQDIS
ncbi:MAG: amidohydrolase family protein [Balneolales bacterium]